MSAKETQKIAATIEAGRIETVQMLLGHRAKPKLLPNVRGMPGNPPALETAIETSANIEIIRLLLDHGARIRDSLGAAIEKNRVDVLKLLLAHGATIGHNIPEPLAAKREASLAIRNLLRPDNYQPPGKNDGLHPNSLNELAQDDEIVRKLYRNPRLILADNPETGGTQTTFTYLQVKVIRNAIFARYGYAFDTKWLRNHFAKNFTTYHPEP